MLDEGPGGGGGECWRCGGFGLCEDAISEAEARQMGLLPPGMTFVGMHLTRACPECPAGERLRAKMKPTPPPERDT